MTTVPFTRYRAYLQLNDYRSLICVSTTRPIVLGGCSRWSSSLRLPDLVDVWFPLVKDVSWGESILLFAACGSQYEGAARPVAYGGGVPT